MAALIFTLTLSVYVGTAGGSLTSTDAVVTYNLTASLVDRGSIALQSGEAGYRRGRDGRMYSWFGIGQSVYNVPFYLAGRAAARVVDVGPGLRDSIPKAVVGLSSTLPAAGCAAVLFLFSWRLTRTLRASLVAAFALAFGTILWPYARFGFNTPLAAFLVLSGTYLVWRGLRNAETGRLFAGGCALGAALLTRHELGVVALPVFALLVAESRPPGRRTVSNVVTVAIPLAAAMAIWLAYNFARFGDPLDSGQVIAGQPSIDMLRSPSTTFGRSMTESPAGLLFSPSTSVFLYSPIVIIGILSFALMARRELSTTVVVAVQALGYLLLVAAAGNWSAGRAYGSRYLVTVVPLVCLPLAYWFRDAGMLARRSGFVVLAASVLVQLPGVLVDYSRVEQAYAYAHAPQPVQERLWSWPAADLVLNARAAARQLPLNVRLLRGAEPRPTVGPTGMTRRASLTEQLAFSLDFWWLYLFHLGVLPARVAVLGLFIPLAVAGVCAWRVARLVHHAERAGP